MRINIYLNEENKRRLDEARGNDPRSRFIVRLLEFFLKNNQKHND